MSASNGYWSKPSLQGWNGQFSHKKCTAPSCCSHFSLTIHPSCQKHFFMKVKFLQVKGNTYMPERPGCPCLWLIQGQAVVLKRKTREGHLLGKILNYLSTHLGPWTWGLHSYTVHYKIMRPNHFQFVLVLDLPLTYSGSEWKNNSDKVSCFSHYEEEPTRHVFTCTDFTVGFM
jgi:hypothetical protein